MNMSGQLLAHAVVSSLNSPLYPLGVWLCGHHCRSGYYLEVNNFLPLPAIEHESTIPQPNRYTD
jgi:hypothetical protein